MSASILRLESFAVKPLKSAEKQPDPADVQAAYQDGYAAGVAATRDAELATLSADIQALRADLQLSDHAIAELRKNTVAELFPLLDAMLDALGPHCEAAQLRQALQAELAKVGDTAPLRRPLIRYSSQHAAIVQSCIEQSELTGIRLEESDTPHTTILFETGLVQLDPAQLVQDLKAILDDLLKEQ